MNRKSIFWSIVVLIVLIIGSIIIFAPNTAMKWVGPQVKDVVYFKGEAAGDTARETIYVSIGTRIIPINIDSFRYTMFMEGKKVISTLEKNKIAIPIFSTDTVKLAGTVWHKKMMAIFQQAEKQQKDSVDVRYSGEVFYHFPIVGTKSIPFDDSSKMYAYRLPKMSVEDFNVEKFGLSQVLINVKLKVINDNPVSFTIRNFNYHLELGAGIAVDGKSGLDQEIPQFDSAIIELPVRTDLSVVGESVKSFFTEGRTWPYKIHIKADLYNPQDIYKDVPVELETKDEVKIL